MERTCFDLDGRVAVVIGATSGLGRIMAEGLAHHGADVVPSGRREELVNETCQAIEALGRRTLRHPVDVLSRPSVDALRDAVVKEFGTVDILVNAAGQTLKARSVDVTEDQWSTLMETNLTGALRGCQSFYEPLRDSGRGRVINVASLGSFLAFHEVAAYCAAKSALLSLTRSLACEWAKDGICVNAIAPGIFPTNLNIGFLTGTRRSEEMLMRTPMGRFGKPEELVAATVLLACDGASFITGECLAVDGGYLASGVNS